MSDYGNPNMTLVTGAKRGIEENRQGARTRTVDYKSNKEERFIEDLV